MVLLPTSASHPPTNGRVARVIHQQCCPKTWGHGGTWGGADLWIVVWFSSPLPRVIHPTAEPIGSKKIYLYPTFVPQCGLTMPTLDPHEMTWADFTLHTNVHEGDRTYHGKEGLTAEVLADVFLSNVGWMSSGPTEIFSDHDYLISSKFFTQMCSH